MFALNGARAGRSLGLLEPLPEAHDLAHHLGLLSLIHGHLLEKARVLPVNDLGLDRLVVLDLLCDLLEADHLCLHVAAFFASRPQLVFVPQPELRHLLVEVLNLESVLPHDIAVQGLEGLDLREGLGTILVSVDDLLLGDHFNLIVRGILLRLRSFSTYLFCLLLVDGVNTLDLPGGLLVLLLEEDVL